MLIITIKKFLLFLTIYQFIYLCSTFKIQIQNPIKFPNDNKTVIFFDYLNQTTAIIFFKNGELYFTDNMLNCIKNITILNGDKIFQKVYLNAKRNGFIAVFEQLYYIQYNLPLDSYKTYYHQKLPIIFAYTLNNDQNASLSQNILVTEQYIKKISSLGSQIVYNHTKITLNPNSKIKKCTIFKAIQQIIIYCFQTEKLVHRFRFIYINSTQQFYYTGYQNIYTAANQMTQIVYLNYKLFIQDQYFNIDILSTYNYIQGNELNFSLQNATLIDVFYTNNSYFLLTSKQFIKMFYRFQYLIFIKLQDTQIFPNLPFQQNQYFVAFNTFQKSINGIYSTNQTFLYPLYLCPNRHQYNFIGSFCEYIQCKVSNCIECNFNQYKCTRCQTKYDSFGRSIYQLNSVLGQCEISPFYKSSYKSQYLNQIDQNYNSLDSSFKQTQKIMQNTNELQQFRGELDIITPFFNLFDDYWYYIYHKNQLKNLKILPLFLYFVYKSNEHRNKFGFSSTQINQNSFFLYKNVKKYKFFTDSVVLDVEKEETSFLYSLRYLFIRIFIITLIFTFLKLTILIREKYLKKEKKQSKKKQNKTNKKNKIFNLIKKLFNKVYNIIKQKIILQTFLVLLFQGNLIFLSFHSGLQLNIFFSFQIQSKFNLSFFLLLYFAIIQYSLFFYVNFSKNKLRKQSYKTMKNTHIKEFNPFLSKALFLGIKNLLFGFVHSFLLDFTNTQLSLLIFIKLMLLILCIKLQIIFIHKCIKYMTISYYLSGIGLDILLFFSKANLLSQLSNIFVYSLEIAFLSILMISVILNLIFTIIFEIKFLLNQNKIVIYVKKQKKIKKQHKFLKNFIQKKQIQKKNLFLLKQNTKNTKNDKQKQDLIIQNQILNKNNKQNKHKKNKFLNYIFSAHRKSILEQKIQLKKNRISLIKENQNKKIMKMRYKIKHLKQSGEYGIKKQILYNESINNKISQKQIQNDEIIQDKNIILSKNNKRQQSIFKINTKSRSHYLVSYQNHHNLINQQEYSKNYQFQRNNNVNRQQKKKKEAQNKIIQINSKKYKIFQDLVI